MERTNTMQQDWQGNTPRDTRLDMIDEPAAFAGTNKITALGIALLVGVLLGWMFATARVPLWLQ